MPRDKSNALAWEIQDPMMRPVRSSIDTPDAHRIVVTLSNDGKVSLELFERTPGTVSIRTHDGWMVLEPEASNTITIHNRTYIEAAEQQEKEKKKRGNRR